MASSPRVGVVEEGAPAEEAVSACSLPGPGLVSNSETLSEWLEEGTAGTSSGVLVSEASCRVGTPAFGTSAMSSSGSSSGSVGRSWEHVGYTLSTIHI